MTQNSRSTQNSRKTMSTLKEKTAQGLFWGALSNGTQQFLNLLFGIILARMLSQSDYGKIGLLAIFSALATTLQNGGFISAINRKKHVTHDDYNAVFWTSVLVSFALYLILFFSAPLISSFYGIPELTPLARFLFLGFFIASFGVASGAYMFRNMMVKQTAILSISSILISGIVGTVMAAKGYAYWGLAAQNTVCIIVGTVMGFYFTKWHPTLPVNFKPIKEMIGFSSKLIITNVFTTINSNLFSVILGKIYTEHDVGNYTQANKWNLIGTSFVSNMLNGIAQPVFAKTSDELDRQRNIFRKLLRFTAFATFPAMLGLALVSKELIVITITEKWLESAGMMQILCVAGAFIPLSNLFSNLIISRGHSSIYMWCTAALCLIQLVSAIIAAPYGISTMIMIYAAINILWLLVWHHFAYREIGITLIQVIRDISPYLFISLSLIVAAHFLTMGIDNIYLRIISKIAFVASLYFLILWMLGSTILREAAEFFLKKVHLK